MSTLTDPSMCPTLVVHADWSASAPKRVMAYAFFNGLRQYHVYPPEPVGELETFLDRLQGKVMPQGCVFLGFDFPIGLPLSYARKAAIKDFLEVLPVLGKNEWSAFYSVADYPGEVEVRRPFYPSRPGSARQQHLLDGLGVKTVVGLFGMLNVVLGFKPEGEPPGEEVRRIEGWILGQSAAYP